VEIKVIHFVLCSYFVGDFGCDRLWLDRKIKCFFKHCMLW